MEITELLSRLKSFEASLDEDLSEETMEDTIEDTANAPDMKTELSDDMSLVDTLAAKTNIARSLEALQVAVNDFKDASIEKLDLLGDNELIGAVESLDLALTAIENALNPKPLEPDVTDLNAAFMEPLEGEVDDELPTGPAEEDEDEEEVDFDSVAELDLLHREEE